MMESLFNEVASLKAGKFIKKKLQQRCFPFIFKIFKNTFLQITPSVAAFYANVRISFLLILKNLLTTLVKES